jgi:hypothetical protein
MPTEEVASFVVTQLFGISLLIRGCSEVGVRFIPRLRELLRDEVV